MGDKLLLKLNMYGRPIANKYCEGKTKRTLERGLKDLKPLRRKRWERGGLRRTWVSGSGCTGGGTLRKPTRTKATGAH